MNVNIELDEELHKEIKICGINEDLLMKEFLPNLIRLGFNEYLKELNNEK